MSSLSTHVLDTSLGKPAKGVRVTLEREGVVVGNAVTDEDGRVREFRTTGALLDQGSYRLIYAVADWFKSTSREAFYTEVAVQFMMSSSREHYHVPLLLSPYGYTTYRGS